LTAFGLCLILNPAIQTREKDIRHVNIYRTCFQLILFLTAFLKTVDFFDGTFPESLSTDTEIINQASTAN